MVTMVEAALLQAQPQDREAFLLYVVEGFTPDEISVISDRSVEQVRKSVVSAREFLRKSLPMPDEFKDKLLQHAKIA
jgi:DNA-directed RNA polymerase specialized sigma24 family protein